MGKSITNLTRLHLARLFTGVGVEVGVDAGAFSKIICEENKGVKLFGVDPWLQGHHCKPEFSQETVDLIKAEAIRRTEGHDWTPIRKFSVDAAKDFEDESLDFVYIDGLHDYESASADIKAWYPKVKKGGILSGHDYVKGYNDKWFGVIQAVDEFVKLYSLDLTIWGKAKSPSWSVFK